MTEKSLDSEERARITAGSWFSALPSITRHDLLRLSSVRRFNDNEVIAMRGEKATHWFGCAKGAVRVSSISGSGKQSTLEYLEAGAWFGELELIDHGRRTHDAIAHGSTTVVCIERRDFEALLRVHPCLGDSLMRLQASRMRNLLAKMEDMSTLTVRARLAKQLLQLALPHGVANERLGEAGIGLRLVQEELAQLIGSSRQRVNHELNVLERRGAIRRVGGIVLVRYPLLQRFVNAESTAGRRARVTAQSLISVQDRTRLAERAQAWPSRQRPSVSEDHLPLNIHPTAAGS